MRGRVLASPDGGSTIHIHCGTDGRAGTTGMAMAAVLLVLVFVDFKGALIFGPVVGLFAVLSHLGNRRITRQANPEADYLVSRIEAAIKAAESGNVSERRSGLST